MVSAGAGKRGRPGQARAVAKTHHSALVLIPPESLWEPIQAFRQRHDAHFRRWMPHVSLLYPFAPSGRWERLDPRISAACAGTGRFRLTLAEVGFFRHANGGFTLWLAPEPAAPVRELQQRLLKAAPGYDDTGRVHGGFAPHLSLGQVARRAGLDSLRQQLTDSWTPLELEVTDVCLIQRGDPPKDRFRVVRRFQLGRRGEV
jgi:2'-5' RNA ligase